VHGRQQIFARLRQIRIGADLPRRIAAHVATDFAAAGKA
jgi:hypothetical protein